MTPPRRRLAGLLVALATVASVALVVVPAWYVQPFAPQTPQGLQCALAIREASPLATVALGIVVIAGAAMLWRGARRWRKAAVAFACLVAGAAVGVSRFNHFEAMFAPLRAPRFVEAPAADFVDDSDVVLAIDVGGEAVAYPVRQMAYHHVVQDTVGGVPVVATY